MRFSHFGAKSRLCVFVVLPGPELSDIKRSLGIVSATMHDQVRVHLPVIDIVCGGAFGTLGLPRHVDVTDKVRERGMDALDRLGIAGIADRDVMTLSTGQVRPRARGARAHERPFSPHF